LDLAELSEVASLFSDPTTWQPIKFASIFAINGQPPDFGMFLKKKDFPTVGWYGLPSHGKETTLPIGGKQTEGMLFETINMVVIDQSPRLVEVTENGTKAYAEALACKEFNETKSEDESAKEYDPLLLNLSGGNTPIIGVYCDENNNYTDEFGNPYGGAELYNEIQDKYPKGNYCRLRTWYLVYLLNDQNELLHSVPVVLSVAGLVAVEIAEALKQLSDGLFSGMSALPGQGKMTMAKTTKAGLRKVTVQLQFQGGKAGKNNNYITKVKRNEEGYCLIGAGRIKDAELREQIEETAAANDGFSYRFAKQNEAEWGGNQLMGAVEQALLPSAKLENITTATEVLY
jgi:hypothetical protein